MNRSIVCMSSNMVNLFKKELAEIYSFLKSYYRETVIISLASLFFILDSYHPIEPSWLGSLIYYAVLPILTIVVLLRRNPLDFGFRLGNFKTWGFHVAIAFVIGLPVLYIASRSLSLEGYYTVEQFSLAKYFWETALLLFAWEFVFRGFLLFGLKERFGEASILIQMVPFVLLHIGKPEIETISTILMGLYLGYVAYRGNSYWPAFIIHLFINISFRVFVNLL